MTSHQTPAPLGDMPDLDSAQAPSEDEEVLVLWVVVVLLLLLRSERLSEGGLVAWDIDVARQRVLPIWPASTMPSPLCARDNRIGVYGHLDEDGN